MASEGTERIRIAVAVAINGSWAACSSFAAKGMTDDEIDQVNAWKAERELNALGAQSPFRINMVEADVILPILENKEVVVRATGSIK